MAIVTEQEVSTMFDHGVSSGYKYMLIIRDAHMKEEFQLYAKDDADAWVQYNHHHKFGNLVVRSVYDLSSNKADQMFENPVNRMPPVSTQLPDTEGLSFEAKMRLKHFAIRCITPQESVFTGEKTLYFTNNGRQEMPLSLAPHEAAKLIEVLKKEFGLS